jgi:hypothetical protein
MLMFYLSNETTIFEHQLIIFILILEKLIPIIYLFIYQPTYFICHTTYLPTLPYLGY